MADAKKQPKILVIWGDDIGIWNLSCYSHGTMGYKTPNIDHLAKEGMMFTDSYGEQSCSAGRASFITGQSGFRTGLTKVGFPGVDIGLQAEDPTIAELLKPQGYATGQFGKNKLAAAGAESRHRSERRRPASPRADHRSDARGGAAGKRYCAA
jgi:arylsulfatase